MTSFADNRKRIGAKVRILEQVTFHHIKMELGTCYMFRFMSGIFLGEDNRRSDVPDTDGERQDPPHLANVMLLDLDAKGYIVEDRSGQIIVPAILRKELEKRHAGDGIIGHCYAITPEGKKKRAGSKGEYTTFDIAEIAIDAHDDETGEVFDLEAATEAQEEVRRPSKAKKG